VADLLKEAYDLYRRHARALLLTCAFLFVPVSFVKSCALSVIMGPAVTAASSPSAAPGSAALFVLSLLGMLVTGFFLYGIVVPLTNGALTITAADRILAGNAGWREAWTLLFRRLSLLLSAVMPAAILIAIALGLTVIPLLGLLFLVAALVMGLLFAFVAPVVLIEGLGGRAALRRSAELVRSDWLRVTIMILVLAVICALAQQLAYLLLPRSAPFFGSFFGDMFTMLVLPVPVLGVVLLYFDIRRKRESFTQERLRADLEALRSA
jgi:hypothetical protein